MVDRDLPTDARTAWRTFYTHPSPVVLTTLVAGFIPLRLVLGDWSWWDLIIPAALLAWWPIHEWIIHILVLHARPIRFLGRTWDLKVARIHRDHHQDPWHLPHVFIPFHIVPWTGIPLIIAAYLMIPAPLATTFLTAYLLLSLHYEWCHYLAHIDWCPKIPYYQRRVRAHRWHHFRHERLWWGVSMGAGDTILGTSPPIDSVARSPSTHDLLAGPWFSHADAHPNTSATSDADNE